MTLVPRNRRKRSTEITTRRRALARLQPPSSQALDGRTRRPSSLSVAGFAGFMGKLMKLRTLSTIQSADIALCRKYSVVKYSTRRRHLIDGDTRGAFAQFEKISTSPRPVA